MLQNFMLVFKKINKMKCVSIILCTSELPYIVLLQCFFFSEGGMSATRGNSNTALKNGTDKLTISSELLLKIDALVLNGVIGSTEAAALRRLIIDSRGSLADDLHDMAFENDAELLVELRHFSKTCKE